MLQKFKYHFLIFLFGVLALIGIAVNTSEKPNLLEVYFFDVGEGDATLIETPAHSQILIDGGPNKAVVEKLGRTLPFYDRKIELIILTHPDTDHLRGLIEVLKRYDTDLILSSNIKCDTTICQEWEKLIKDKNVPVKTALAGEIINLGDNLTLKVLSAASASGGDSDNSGSMVTRLDYGKDSFLFTGDAEKDTEEKLIKSGENIIAEVLKVGHHGSKTSTEESFLEKVAPKIAVISVGKNNRYGHPTAEVLDRLAAFGAEILRTDQSGDIRIFSDGEGLKMQ